GGESVYIGSRASADRVGEGFVSAVNGKSYTVEVTSGSLVMDDNVAIFRSHDFNAASKIGNGKIARKANIPITADGSIFAMHVRQGQQVRRGDPLFETVTGSLAYNLYPTRQIVSGYAAVVASVDVNPGGTVSQNQLLATLYLLDDFQIAVQATEADLAHVTVGDTVRLELTDVRNAPLEGVVSSISGLSSSGTDEPEYTIYIDFDAFDAMRAGMLVNVYCNES
ncbi:MAG: HlyD family efflux transporter periplasmic adaptor subunit, partial [Firmicutes bacterium]|nr:HlyD family efflux transporter periplasmic adaptor subunit [Bacillota bacterium]